jgi:hypothetical protein
VKLHVAAIAVIAALGGMTGIGIDAHASTPGIGNYCTKDEVDDLRHTQNGWPTVCTYMGGGGGYLWVETAGVDPVVRVPGQSCDDRYPVAATQQGKAIMCFQGQWTYGP